MSIYLVLEISWLVCWLYQPVAMNYDRCYILNPRNSQVYLVAYLRYPCFCLFPWGCQSTHPQLVSFSHSVHFLFSCSLQAGCQPASQVRWWYEGRFWGPPCLHILTASRSVLHLTPNCVAQNHARWSIKLSLNTTATMMLIFPVQISHETSSSVRTTNADGCKSMSLM